MKTKTKSPPLDTYEVGDLVRTTEDHPRGVVDGKVQRIESIEFGDGYRQVPRIELLDGTFIYITRPEWGERLR